MAALFSAVMTAVRASVSAVMAFALLVMVAAKRVRIIRKASIEQPLHRAIRVPADARVKFKSGVAESHSCASADSAADQSVHAKTPQKASQCSVTVSIRIHDLR